MKKILLRILAVIIAAISIYIGSWYITFMLIPQLKASKVVSKFEVAARAYDQKTIKEITTTDSRLRSFSRELYNEYFDKFYNGVEITSCIRRQVNILPSNKDIIWARGKMKAKIDGKYREHFEFQIKLENGEWKLRQFAFPDYVNY